MLLIMHYHNTHVCQRLLKLVTHCAHHSSGKYVPLLLTHGMESAVDHLNLLMRLMTFGRKKISRSLAECSVFFLKVDI